MSPNRSILFVPGNKPDWMEKAVKYGADVLVLDLEDSIPPVWSKNSSIAGSELKRNTV